MNKTKLKNYAPAARLEFIRAVTDRAHLLGLTEHQIAPTEQNGELIVVNGRAFSQKVAEQRQKLVTRIQRDGFQPVMETIAYTWFNRFAALRYLEIHGYLEHGFRVLSHPSGGAIPEILEHAEQVEWPGLNCDQVVELKLSGNQDAELYRRLLVAQCNALAAAMPFLFEHIDDETELLLPDNLLHSDSLIRTLVNAIDEADWQEVEIIGWLYQFYISEKKDQVIGKVVKSEDIPAATQLFTPNWIVQYLVQNSVGRLWLMANPASNLKSRWPYYIMPAEQAPEVQAQLDALIQTRMDADGGSINPETITVLDPACGSGHILVEAYEVLKAIYMERGYQPRSIPRLILEKNLYGLDIDDRAAQLAGFALLMKARADDRRLLENPPKLNVLGLQESKGLGARATAQALDTAHGTPVDESLIRTLIETFAHAKTFGSLIQIPQSLNMQLPKLAEDLQMTITSGGVLARPAAEDLWPLVEQAKVLSMQYDAVVANPPYMGSKGMNADLKDYAKSTFPVSKSDLFAMFIERGFGWCKPTGFNSMVTMQSWMFLSSYEAMREKLLSDRTIHSMAHLGARAFSEISGEVVQTTAFVFQGRHFSGFRPVFFRLVDGQEDQKESDLRSGQHRFDATVQDDFKKIPGCPIAYWVDDKIASIFSSAQPFDVIGKTRRGLQTGDAGRFIRGWHEVSKNKVGCNLNRKDAVKSGLKWFPFNSGGTFRKWYGNIEDVVNWEKDGADIKATGKAIIPSEQLYFRQAITWPKVSSRKCSFRWFPDGIIPGDAGPCFYDESGLLDTVLCFSNSKVALSFLQFLSPTLNFEVGVMAKMPIIIPDRHTEKRTYCEAIDTHKTDWDSYETSLDFTSLPLLNSDCHQSTLKATYYNLRAHWHKMTLEMQRLEEENNRIFIEAYGLQDELTPEVPLKEITLTCNPHYRYGGDKTEEELEALLLADTMREFLSYATGCMFGRYSLDEPGLIYAHSGNIGFDHTRYKTFPADDDGILPITDELWFSEDAALRIREFLLAVWGPDTLEENVAWLAESLVKRGTETPDETIRRYLADKFFKDHLQTYKKRSIYWLFSSGKQGAFQALVYLHRYQESTLARMRAEYVIPLTRKMQSRVELLKKEVEMAPSTASRNKFSKELSNLGKKQSELLAYDEKLRHYADMRIPLDLDDGVKVNYGKFGDLLAEVKAVTGGSGDD